MATEYRNNAKVNVVTRRYGVSTSLLHPPLPALPLKLAYVIERIHESAAALTIESLPPLNHEKRRHG